MNAEEEQALAMALLNYARSKKKLGQLQKEARTIGVRLKGLAKLLRSSPQDIHIQTLEGDSAALIDPGRIAALVADIQDTLGEIKQLEDKVKELGLVI
jgi:hypothetical protein